MESGKGQTSMIPPFQSRRKGVKPPLAQLVHTPQCACKRQPRSGAWPFAEQLFANGFARGCEALETKENQKPPLAQLVEQLTLNQWVPGSSP